MHSIFISHASEDGYVVSLFAKLINRISLGQIQVWYSSDREPDGGFAAGDDWRNRILMQIRDCEAVIAFITPNSVNRPWIMYECGYADSLEEHKLIPIKMLVDIRNIPSPIQHKEFFGLSSLEDATVLLGRILNRFHLYYDADVYRDIVNHSISEMKNAFHFSNMPKEYMEMEYLSSRIDVLCDYLYNASISRDCPQDVFEISVSYIDSNNIEIKDYIRVERTYSISDILDLIYYMISDLVSPYRYMEEWIVKSERENRFVVVSDYQTAIPAVCIFKPATQWRVVFLNKPYEPNNEYNMKNNVPRTYWLKSDCEGAIK